MDPKNLINLGILPLDIIWSIFLFLVLDNHRALVALKRTCKAFRTLIQTRYKPQYPQWDMESKLKKALHLELEKDVPYYSQPLWFKWAGKSGDLATVKWVKNRVHNIASEEDYIEALIMVGADVNLGPIEKSSEDYAYLAARYHHPKVLQMFLPREAYSNALLEGAYRGKNIELLKALEECEITVKCLWKMCRAGTDVPTEHFLWLTHIKAKHLYKCLRDAIKSGNINMVSILLKHPNAKGKIVDSIIHASEKGHLEILKLLGQPSPFIMFWHSFRYAFCRGHVHIMKYVYEEHEQFIKDNIDAITFKHLNIKKGVLDGLLFLRSKGLTMPYTDMDYILHQSCIYGYYHVVEYLIKEQEFKPSLLKRRIAEAATFNYTDIIQLLKSK